VRRIFGSNSGEATINHTPVYLESMANEMNTDQAVRLLNEAKKVAKAAKLPDPENSFVIVGVAQLLAVLQRKEKKVLIPGATRPDPVQEARKTPRKPLLPGTGGTKKKTTAKTATRKR